MQLMRNKEFYFFFGTMAEFIKLAPVIREFQKRGIKFKIITSGQGRISFGELSGYLKPIAVEKAFSYKSKKSSVFLFIFWSLKTLFTSLKTSRREFKNKQGTYLIIHGDTVTSLLGAVISRIFGLKLVHIESGLRSFDFFEPFPEEICRFVISYLASIHFCPNERSRDNLNKVGGVKINTSNNTLIETYQFSRSAKKFPVYTEYIKRIGEKYFVMVIHRQEHVIFGKRETQKYIKWILENARKDLKCVFVGHEIAGKFLELSKDDSNLFDKLVIVPRIPYLDFMKLLEKSEFIVTDGGSNQEEAYYMGKPCLILRNRTERIEGLNYNVVLAKGNRSTIKQFLKNYRKCKKNKIRVNKRPAKIIVDYLLSAG